MKKKIRLLLLFTLLALGWLLFPWACKKEDTRDCPPDLPCATMTGENTFGCYIDGKPWVAGIENNWTPGLRAIDALYDEPGTGLLDIYYWKVLAKMYNENYSDIISIGSSPLYQPSVLDNSTKDDISTLILLDSSIGKRYYIDTLLPYRIEITNLDISKNIISGRFDFYATSQNRLDTIHLYNGRFDVKYQPD